MALLIPPQRLLFCQLLVLIEWGVCVWWMTGFEGIAVGVGTGKILGKIQIVNLTPWGNDFFWSNTIMVSMERLCVKNVN